MTRVGKQSTDRLPNRNIVKEKGTYLFLVWDLTHAGAERGGSVDISVKLYYNVSHEKRGHHPAR